MCDLQFDKSMIYLLRKITKNFMLAHKDRSINELPISIAPIVDSFECTLEEYIEDIVMKMGTDA